MRAEMLKAAKLQPKSSDKQGSADGIVLRLLTKVVDKVQITVRNVHLRYEDHVTNPRVSEHCSKKGVFLSLTKFQRGFSVGVTLEELSLHTTPATAMSAVYQRLIHKVLTVRNLALYWTADPPVQYTSVSELIHVMDQFVSLPNLEVFSTLTSADCTRKSRDQRTSGAVHAGTCHLSRAVAGQSQRSRDECTRRSKNRRAHSLGADQSLRE